MIRDDDGLGVGQQHGEAARGAEGPERDQERGNGELRGQKAVDEDDIIPIPAPAPTDNNQMDIDGQPSSNGTAKKRALEFDDDDLQAKLAEQRRQALKKRKKTDAAELARRIRDEESATPMQTVEDDEEPGLVIDETTEFVSNLRRPQSVTPEEGPRHRAASTPTVGHAADEDTAMAESYAAVEDEEEVRARLEAEEREASTAGPVTSTGFEEEDVVASGVGASLSMLRKRGLITDTGAAEQNAKDRALSGRRPLKLPTFNSVWRGCQ